MLAAGRLISGIKRKIAPKRNRNGQTMLIMHHGVL
jgi:hypothetical protein